MKFGFTWGKMAVTHFVAQFTHVSRHFGVYSRKKKYIYVQIREKMAYVSIKLLLEKCSKIKNKT